MILLLELRVECAVEFYGFGTAVNRLFQFSNGAYNHYRVWVSVGTQPHPARESLAVPTSKGDLALRSLTSSDVVPN